MKILNMEIGGCYDTVEVDFLSDGNVYSATVEVVDGDDPITRIAGPMVDGSGPEIDWKGDDLVPLVTAALDFYDREG